MKIWDYINKIYTEWIGLHEGTPLIETRHKSYFDGREFRAFFDLNIATGQSAVIKFVSPVEFALHSQHFEIVSGELQFEAILGGTEGGSFSNAVAKFGNNRTSFRPFPYYESQVSLNSGGTITGGTVSELVRVKTSTNSNFASTVGKSVGDERFLPAGTYYLKFTAVEAIKGVYSLQWEEHP